MWDVLYYLKKTVCFQIKYIWEQIYRVRGIVAILLEFFHGLNWSQLFSYSCTYAVHQPKPKCLSNIKMDKLKFRITWERFITMSTEIRNFWINEWREISCQQRNQNGKCLEVQGPKSLNCVRFQWPKWESPEAL